MLRYALVYHLLLGKESAEIDGEDIGWAARLAERHLADGARLLDGYGVSDLEKKVRKVEEMVRAARETGGLVKAREVCRAVKSVSSVLEARALLQLVLEDDPGATEAEKQEAFRPSSVRGSKATPSMRRAA